MSVAMPFPPGHAFPANTAVWPDGSISFDHAAAVAVSLAQIPLVPFIGIANAIASTLSELSPRTPATIVVIGTLESDSVWRPVCAGASSSDTERPTNRVEFSDSVSVPLGASGALLGAGSAAYVFNKPSKVRAQYLDVVARSGGAFDSSMSMTIASSQPSGHVVGVVWDGGASALTPLAISYLRCVMARVIDVVNSAFPDGITKTPMFTARELSVTRLLLMGKTVQEIARISDCSRFTVHDHVKSVYRKLGVHSRGELFYRVGLLDTEMLV